MDRRELVRQYKETPRPAGIFGVRNTASGRVLIGASVNLPGVFNRERFQLAQGSHPDRELQQDWNRLGPDAFAFETLDRLEPADAPGADQAAELRALLRLWLDKLAAAGVPLYPESRRGA